MENSQTFIIVLPIAVGSVRDWEHSDSYWTGNRKGIKDRTGGGIFSHIFFQLFCLLHRIVPERLEYLTLYSGQSEISRSN